MSAENHRFSGSGFAPVWFMWIRDLLSLHVWNGGCDTRLPGRLGGLREVTSAVASVHRLVVVQSLSHVLLFATPSMAATQACLSFTISQSLLRLTSIVLIMPSSHLILCHPLLLLPSIFPSIRVFSSESALRIRWPKYWSFSFSMSPSNEYSGLISFGID